MMDKERLVLEHMAMRDRWGDKPKLCSNSKKSTIWWEYTVCLEKCKFPIKIIYPDLYPSDSPEIKCMMRLPSKTPHRYDYNILCWHRSVSSNYNNSWEPSRDTAALCIGVAYKWFMAYLVWRTTDEWPVEHA